MTHTIAADPTVEFKVSLTKKEVALLLFILADSKSDTTSFLRTSIKNYWTQAKALSLKLRVASGEEYCEDYR